MVTTEARPEQAPAPLLEGDPVYVGRGSKVWEVAALSDTQVAIKRARPDGSPVYRYLYMSQVMVGALRRVNGVPILGAREPKR